MITWLATGRTSRPATTRATGFHILVAEDEESIRDICQRALTQAGYRVTVVADGQAAIDLLARAGGDFDLVLADVIMPVAGGEAISDYLRRSELDIKVIYATGYSMLGTPPDGVDLLRKPYTLAQLLGAVKAALEPEPNELGENPP
jgi:two-component system cell cycle sensor histidine kinase/response regulator CckA